MSGPFVFQVVGYKHTGKTTLVCRLVQAFKRSGYRVGTIKHDGHDFEIDKRGTDTWKHRESGAEMVAIASAFQTAMIEDRPVGLEELVGRMSGADIVIVEGFKAEPYPKIVLLKEPAHLELLERVASPVAAVCWYVEKEEDRTTASDGTAKLPRFAIGDAEGVFQLMFDLFNSHNSPQGGEAR